MKAVALAGFLLLIGFRGALHAQVRNTAIVGQLGVGGIPYPIGNGGCGDGTPAGLVSGGIKRRMTSVMELEFDVALLHGWNFYDCKTAPALVTYPGVYRVREYRSQFKDPLVAPSLKAHLFLPSQSGLELSFGIGSTVTPQRTRFLLLGAAIRGSSPVSVGIEYRSFWIHHSWTELTVATGGSESRRVIGSGNKPAGGFFVVGSYAFRL